MLTMKKLICVMVLLLAAGTAVFAQKGGSVSIGFGLKMNPDINGEWVVEPSLAMAGRYYFVPLTDTIDFGVSFLWNNFWLRDKMLWIAPDGTEKNLTTGDGNYIMDIGMILGAGLRFNVPGPLVFALDGGVWFNALFCSFPEAYWSLLYGDLDLEYNNYDFGPGVNTAIQFDIGRFMLEVSVNAVYTLVQFNSWTLTDSDDSSNIVDRGDGGQRDNGLRLTPAILFGMRI